MPSNLSPLVADSLVHLVSGLHGINHQKALDVVSQAQMTTTVSDISHHFSVPVISFVNKRVLSNEPQLSLEGYLAAIKTELANSTSYSDFYKKLHDKKLVTLKGQFSDFGKRAVIFTKGSDETNVVHESIHRILSFTGKRTLSYSEPFVVLLEFAALGKGNVRHDFLAKKRNFVKSFDYALATFPWLNITPKDIAFLESRINRVYTSDSTLLKQDYARLGELVTPRIGLDFLRLLEQKLPQYPIQERAVVKALALKYATDCAGLPEFRPFKQKLEQIASLC